MLRKKRTLLYAALLLTVSSCTKNFDKINTNPNSPENINSDYLMSEVILSTAYAYQTDAFKERPVEAGRYITLVQTTINDLFTWGAVSWDDIYSRLSVNQQMYNQAEAGGEKQYLAIAKIMKAFNFGYLTDLYGDVPFAQALQSKTGGITQPVYDEQKKIYPALLQMLEEANELLRNNPGTINPDQDVLFGGKALQWRKFANALRLRMLLRASRQYANAFTEMQAMLNDADRYPLPASNADDAAVKYIEGTAANSWPGSTLTMIDFDFTKTKASKELVDNLTALNDPRLAAWVAPVATTEGATVNKSRYVGVPNAIDDPRSYNGGETHQSTLGSMFRKGSGDMLKASMITYTEVCFILAEALQAGKITVTGKTAADFYNAGIQASMTFYGVQSTAVSNGYYDQALVKYNGTLEQLITQKWLAMLFKGGEGWFDHRRTGFPRFTIGPLAVKNIVPRRYRYPTSELANNRLNYLNGVKTFGEDDEYTLMWYLK